MWREPSVQEINRWRLRLESREFQQSLLAFQEWVYRIFEDLRKMTGNRLIRVVLPRHAVKTLGSVIDKIRRRRQAQKGGEKPYDFHMIDDLTGIKVLCPYESSAIEVIEWMLRQPEKLQVAPRSARKALVKRPGGYRGWHFVATPVPGREPRWVGVKCEVQMKTMLQEAWDAQTHDITYKREEKIDPILLRTIKEHSKVLQKFDKKAERLRTKIQRVEEIEERMKDAAAAVNFWKSNEILREIEKEFSFRVPSKVSMLKCKPLPPVGSSPSFGVKTFRRRASC